MPKLLASMMLLIAIAGCVSAETTEYTFQSFSAGHTGCVPEENIISNEKPLQRGVLGYSWNASCNNKTYFCTMVGARYETSCALAQ